MFPLLFYHFLIEEKALAVSLLTNYAEELEEDF